LQVCKTSIESIRDKNIPLTIIKREWKKLTEYFVQWAESDDEIMKNLTSLYCSESLKNLDLRVPADNCFSRFSIFDPINAESAELKEEKFISLFNQYSSIINSVESIKRTGLISERRAITEWSMFTDQTKYFRDTKNSVEVCQRIISTDSFDFFACVKALARIALTLPITSVPAERGFSQMKLIKTANRSCLKQETLNYLMNIRMNGDEFLAPEAAEDIANMWLAMRNRSTFGITPESDVDETENSENVDIDDLLDENLEFDM
jgi:hypothetical protein